MRACMTNMHDGMTFCKHTLNWKGQLLRSWKIFHSHACTQTSTPFAMPPIWHLWALNIQLPHASAWNLSKNPTSTHPFMSTKLLSLMCCETVDAGIGPLPNIWARPGKRWLPAFCAQWKKIHRITWFATCYMSWWQATKRTCNRDNWLSGPLLAFLDWFPDGILIKQFQAAGGCYTWFQPNGRSQQLNEFKHAGSFSPHVLFTGQHRAKRCPKKTSNSPRANNPSREVRPYACLTQHWRGIGLVMEVPSIKVEPLLFYEKKDAPLRSNPQCLGVFLWSFFVNGFATQQTTLQARFLLDKDSWYVRGSFATSADCLVPPKVQMSDAKVLNWHTAGAKLRGDGEVAALKLAGRKRRLVIVAEVILEPDASRLAKIIECDKNFSKGCWIVARTFHRIRRCGHSSEYSEVLGSHLTRLWDPVAGLSSGSLINRLQLKASGFRGDGTDDELVRAVVRHVQAKPFLGVKAKRRILQRTGKTATQHALRRLRSRVSRLGNKLIHTVAGRQVLEQCSDKAETVRNWVLKAQSRRLQLLGFAPKIFWLCFAFDRETSVYSIYSFFVYKTTICLCILYDRLI